MREISADIITKAVETLCLQAAYDLGADVEKLIREALAKEESAFGIRILENIVNNIEIARREEMPICQDTGLAAMFIEIGQDLHIKDGFITDAINQGVRQGYEKGYLRKSVLADPLFSRKNTGDNTPAMIHYDIVPGDGLHIAILPKGGGSEGVSALKMLRPADGVEGVKKFVMDTILEAGGKPCPPIIVGIGIGGSMDKVAFLAKKALTREAGTHHSDPRYASLEQTLLKEINKTGIGPNGLGGRNTALAVHIEDYPTHMACLPVAVNVNCHAARYKEINL